MGVGVEAGLTWSQTTGHDFQSGMDTTALFPAPAVGGDGTAQDVVIFCKIPYHLFWYRVLQHPDASFLPGSARCTAQPHPYTGETDPYCYLSVNVPAEPSEAGTMRLDDYNAHAEAEGFPRVDIGYPSSYHLADHPVGDPRAYPDYPTALALASQLGGIPFITTTTWTTDMDPTMPIKGILQLSEYMNTDEEMSWSVQAFVKAQTPAAEFEASTGIHGAHSVTITQQSTLKFWGFVPPLSCRNACFDLQASQSQCPAACHDALVDGNGQPLPESQRPGAYSWGMFLRDGTDTSDPPSTFPVLDYFVTMRSY